ncbi:NUDIX hydrolase [Gordoniibacillus kamchatkensis]|nr:NUDIX domain-containing protein [Paenibacillus sp. VKM B-2647]
MFDIWDREGRRIGTASRQEAHERGLWHRTFQCWIYGKDDGGGTCLLFQLRHAGKDTFPGLLDISCAGHLLAGETAADGVRELAEELGIEAAFAELTPCGVYEAVQELANGWIDREFCHVFVLERSLPLAAYRLQPEEVAGLYRVKLADVERMLDGEDISVSGVALRPDGTLADDTRSVNARHFVPHDRAYYGMVLKTLAGLGVAD